MRVKATQRIGVITKLRNLIPTKAKLLLDKSAILPYLSYCYLAQHFSRTSDIRKLERLQEKAHRAKFCGLIIGGFRGGADGQRPLFFLVFSKCF